MVWDMIIYNGTIVTSKKSFIGNIHIKDGKITAISSGAVSKHDARDFIDATGKHVLPGLIDTHIHSRDPGGEHKETFYHSTQAAAAGGITTVFEMPNTNPPINNIENYQKQIRNLSSKAFVDYGIWGICLGELNNKHIWSLHQKGVIGFKFFWGYAIDQTTYQLVYNYEEGMEGIIPPPNEGEVYGIFKEVAKTGQVLAIHAESSDLIQYLTKHMNKGSSYEDMIATRPNLAEELTVQAGIALAKATGVRLHILHVSTKEAVKLIRQAQDEGYPITAETCPHFLFLTNDDYAKIGPQMKVYPLIKFKADQQALWRGIADGTISLVCSDHAPHTEEEKNGDLWSIPAGMCGVETLAPLMINAVSEGKITMEKLVKLLAEEPAKLFGVYPQKGSLQPGTDADITIVDLNKTFTIKRENLHSKGKVTAFDSFNIKGIPVYTIVRGQVVMKDRDILGDPTGQIIKPLQKEVR